MIHQQPRTLLFLAAASLLPQTHAFSAPAASTASPIYNTIQSANSLLDPITGKQQTSIIPQDNKRKSLIVLLPQLGEFDSSEYVEFLTAAQPSLEQNDIDLRIIGIGDTTAASNFMKFTNLSYTLIQMESCTRSWNWRVDQSLVCRMECRMMFLPGGVPEEEEMVRPVATAWLNYMAMCAGIGAPGTLREILRGYFGDKKAPERFRDDDVVKAGFITIGPGVGPTSIGPLKYNQWFSDEKGYQRPVELATIRLKNMVEVLTKWDEYVSNTLAISRRGATYLFDEDGNELYSYKSRGVLTYSETMPRPLTFLSPYIGESVALNPLGLADNGGGELTRGRGVLKPAGKAMKLLSILFQLENKLQAKVLGAEESDYTAARKEIEDTINQNKIVIYTYGLSPFSAETTAVLDEVAADYKNVEVGLEWFLLDKEKSVLRAELLEMTGQSSLPHVFIDGKHVGGLFTGSSDGKYPGLAGLKESGVLQEVVDGDSLE
ncbi:hypothetical protein QTG54_016335 [Skeletonema marinoi]|uniref:Glutaredoxin domain-containing protein n=1 Tax=Skeletonema marinoi TaxID=267567 RepID=A0AAD9D4S9_9STRA|nr:hypothetical protein QTG54_016335 [Skeletonema marinoi]